SDGLLAFVNNFLKEHFLPAIFVDYRKCVQQAISSPAAFRPRVHATSAYSSSVELGRPVLQGLLAIDIIAKEVLGWVQLMPNYATELVEYVRTFLERAHERCRASYMEAVLEKQSYILLSRNDIESLMRLEPANISLQNSTGEHDNNATGAEAVEVEIELSDLLLDMCPIKQENLIHDDQKLILLASLSDSLEYLADSVERLGESFISPPTTSESINHSHGRHARSSSAIPKSLASLANEYRRLAVDCVRVLRLEMQLEAIYHMQEMTKREYVEDQDAEDPDDFIISLTTQIARRDEEMAPYITESERNYIFGGISSVAANASIKALAQMKSINLLGVQQICRNSIALEQALAAIPSIDSEAVQQRLDRVRTFYELLNLPFESLLGFIAEHEYLFSAKEHNGAIFDWLCLMWALATKCLVKLGNLLGMLASGLSGVFLGNFFTVNLIMLTLCYNDSQLQIKSLPLSAKKVCHGGFYFKNRVSGCAAICQNFAHPNEDLKAIVEVGKKRLKSENDRAGDHYRLQEEECCDYAAITHLLKRKLRETLVPLKRQDILHERCPKGGNINQEDKGQEFQSAAAAGNVGIFLSTIYINIYRIFEMIQNMLCFTKVIIEKVRLRFEEREEVPTFIYSILSY
ncbi:hypothetical protein ACJX0J_032772, partial [Zea mays]